MTRKYVCYTNYLPLSTRSYQISTIVFNHDTKTNFFRNSKEFIYSILIPVNLRYIQALYYIKQLFRAYVPYMRINLQSIYEYDYCFCITKYIVKCFLITCCKTT